MIEAYPNLLDLSIKSNSVNATVQVIIAYIRNNPNCPLTHKLNDQYFNVINKYAPYIRIPKFVVQKLTPLLSLRDESNNHTCSICINELNVDQKVILCKSCDRYIGCFECLNTWLKQSNICPHCNK